MLYQTHQSAIEICLMVWYNKGVNKKGREDMYYKYMYESKTNTYNSLYCVVNTDMNKFTVYTNLTANKYNLDLLCGIGNDSRNKMIIKVKTKKDMVNLITILRCDENYKEI